MNILGISPFDKDATACLYLGAQADQMNSGRWSALAEERLSRIKLHKGFPHRAIAALLEAKGLSAGNMDAVVYPFRQWYVEGRRISGGFIRDLPFALTNGDTVRSKKNHLTSYLQWCVKGIREHRHFHHLLLDGLQGLGLDGKLHRIEHHHAHTASAYLTSGFKHALTLSLDWYGGGLSGSVNEASPSGLKLLHEFRYPHSLGLFFAQATAALGFRASRHEGKIVGHAAYGDPDLLSPMILDRFIRENGDFRFKSAMDTKFLESLAARHPREHVAAACQNVLESVVCGIVEYWTKRIGVSDITLAGGVAANVKMNQRIAQIDAVQRVFVHPAMGDGGTSVGAVLAWLLESGPVESVEWRSCLLGPEYSADDLVKAYEDGGLEPIRHDDIAGEIARLLAEGKVVARYNGGSEYGPRALGNRSILSRASDPAINDWLNRRLNRNEFMPFAPATLYEHREQRYVAIERIESAVRFMTITCDCTPTMCEEATAAVHVDGTARPQLVRQADAPDLHAILLAYYEIIGIPTLINTSFNIHEEPIVCSPRDAVRAFKAGHLDVLAMGSYCATLR